MNSLFTYSCIKNEGWAFSSLHREKVSKTSWPSVSPTTSVYITNILISSCMCNHRDRKPPQQALSGVEQINHVYMHVCVCAVAIVWICNCSSHFPLAFELWIIVLVSWTIMRRSTLCRINWLDLNKAALLYNAEVAVTSTWRTDIVDWHQ